MPPYIPTTWSDEIPSESPVKYEITDAGGGLNTIHVVTPITPGTPMNAVNLNKMETGIETAQETAEEGLATAEAAIPKSLVTTIGDLIYATGAAALARLGKPSANSVLSMGDAGVPSWKALTEFFTFVGRKGSNPTNWTSSDNNPNFIFSYFPQAVKIQVGAHEATNLTDEVVFPVSFTYAPIVLLNVYSTNSTLPLNQNPCIPISITATGFTIVHTNGASPVDRTKIMWLAIGE